MKKLSLDIYDDMPEGMKRYLQNYGWHFNKKAFDLATESMRRKTAPDSKEEKIEPYTKEQVEALLATYGIKVEGGEMYDRAYVACMGKADYLKSSIPDEQHLAKYIKDVLDDVDGSDELPFRFWLQKCVAVGKPIDWDEMM